MLVIFMSVFIFGLNKREIVKYQLLLQSAHKD